MRKPVKVSVSLCVAAVALAAVALSGPPKGSVEWHKREYLAAQRRLDRGTLFDQCKHCFSMNQWGMDFGELTPRRLTAYLANESHYQALVDLGHLSECRIFVKDGYVEGVVRTFHNENNCHPFARVRSETGVETNGIRISAPVREILTVSNVVRRIEERLFRQSSVQESAKAQYVIKGEVALPPEVETNITTAIQAGVDEVQIVANGSSGRTQERWQHGVRFDHALDRLAVVADENLIAKAAPESTIQTKLLIIAHDRKRRPDVYAEIESNYVDRVQYVRRYQTSGRPRSIQAPSVKPNHATERYRLVWEHLLLRPQLENSLELYGHRAREALAKVANDKSLTTLKYRFDLGTGALANTDWGRAQQEFSLNAIAAFTSESGFRALLDCAAKAEGQPRRIEGSAEEWDVERWVLERLTSNEQPDYREKWKTVLQHYPDQAPSLSPKQRDLLTRLKAKDEAQ